MYTHTNFRHFQMYKKRLQKWWNGEKKEQTAANKWSICRTLNIPFSFMAVYYVRQTGKMQFSTKRTMNFYRQWPIKKQQAKEHVWMRVWKWECESGKGSRPEGSATGKTLNGKRMIMEEARGEKNKKNVSTKWNITMRLVGCYKLFHCTNLFDEMILTIAVTSISSFVTT